MSAAFRAPQLGLFLPAETDNPARARPSPCPAVLRARLQALRAEFERASFDMTRCDPVNYWQRVGQRAAGRAS